MCVCVGVPAEEGLGSPGVGVIGDCEVLDMGAGKCKSSMYS